MASLRGKQLKQVIDPALAKAFTHPLRGHVWVRLFEKGRASPKEIADELGIDVSEVSYHFRGLRKRKLIKLVRTERRRGFAEHFYEPVAPAFYFDDSDWMQIPAEIRSTLSGEMLRQIIEELIGALETGSLDGRNRHLSRTWLTVDEQGWGELMQVAREALEQVRTVQKKSAERTAKAPEQGIPVSFVMASFETAAAASRQKSPPDGG
jgi:transcription initiation factor IIE alpha subunit